MRKWIGAFCIFLGVVFLFCSAGFVVYNQYEDENAARFTETLLEDVRNVIEEQNPEQNTSQIKTSTVKIDNYECIGVLSIPVLDLELPVLKDWSYAKLKKAPCVYYGSCNENDFVIAAHNYKAHFGRLSQLQEGDIVVFTDVSGESFYYEVVLLETLQKNATNEMLTSGFDLSLYTCTTGGGSRVTVRCRAVNGNN